MKVWHRIARTVLLALPLLVSVREGWAQTTTDAALDARIGTVRAPFDSQALPEVKSTFQAYSLVPAVAVGVDDWRVGFRLPFATSSIEQPAGSYVADYTLGNPELFITRSHEDAFADTRWHVVAGVALGIPAASHGPSTSLVVNRVLAASDALVGWREPGLYRPGVFPITTSVRFIHVNGGARFEFEGRLPVLFRVSVASLTESSRPPRVGTLPNVKAFGSYRLSSWLEAGAFGAAVFELPLPTYVRDVGRSGPFQASVGPVVTWLPGAGVSLCLDFQMAVLGPLDGTFSFGLNSVWTMPWSADE